MPPRRPPAPARRAAVLAAAGVLLTGTAAAARAQPAAGGDAAAVARARADSARLPYTVADVRFMTAMIGHHAQAVAMADLAPARAGSAAVRTLAARIRNAQQDEIATMRRWLRDRRQPLPDAAGAAGAHGAHDHDAGHAGHGSAGGPAGPAPMPGMLTAAELRGLAAARGDEFDQRFVSSMIRHHRGAVGMVRQLLDSPGAAQDETVFRFASDVNVDQTTEIARMQRLLATLLSDRP